MTEGVPIPEYLVEVVQLVASIRDTSSDCPTMCTYWLLVLLLLLTIALFMASHMIDIDCLLSEWVMNLFTTSLAMYNKCLPIKHTTRPPFCIQTGDHHSLNIVSVVGWRSFVKAENCMANNLSFRVILCIILSEVHSVVRSRLTHSIDKHNKKCFVTLHGAGGKWGAFISQRHHGELFKSFVRSSSHLIHFVTHIEQLKYGHTQCNESKGPLYYYHIKGINWAASKGTKQIVS